MRLKTRGLWIPLRSPGDFGFCGQLFQYWMNYASRDVMNERCRRLPAWLSLMDDPGGVEGQWPDSTLLLNKGVENLLWLAGEVYLPYLDATDKAISVGKDRLRFERLVFSHEQKLMKYHAKCLQVIRERVSWFSGDGKTRLQSIVAGIDVWRYTSNQ